MKDQIEDAMIAFLEFGFTMMLWVFYVVMTVMFKPLEWIK